MEQQTQNPTVTETPAQPQVSVETPVQPAGPIPAAPVQKKSYTWAWVLGGCFAFMIIIMVIVLIIGWLGIRKVKKEIDNNQTIEDVKSGLDKMNRESEEWQKKSEELRNNLPDPEGLQEGNALNQE